nr:hypothetical protein Iba_chr14dCG5560 [Ipomoea batatas]
MYSCWGIKQRRWLFFLEKRMEQLEIQNSLPSPFPLFFPLSLRFSCSGPCPSVAASLTSRQSPPRFASRPLPASADYSAPFAPRPPAAFTIRGTTLVPWLRRCSIQLY